MNQQWQDLLADVGVTPAPRPQTIPAAHAALSGLSVCDLSDQGLIVARGPDSASFLQGQLTCDVRKATPAHSVLGAYCTPKGRVLACGRLFQRDDAYWLTLPEALTAPTLARLAKYLLRANTRLECASAKLTRLGLLGNRAQSWLAEQVSSAILELTDEAVLTVQDLTVIRWPGLVPRFALYGSASSLASLWQRGTGAQTITPVTAELWRLLDIEAGIPAVYPATVEAFVPQMLNLHLLGGISFQKGCYTGQEIVARTQYLGKLKRRMYRARLDHPTPPRPGEGLFSPEAGPSQNPGQVVDAAPHPDGGYALLVVALIDYAESGTLRLGAADGPALRLESLPYAVTPAGSC